MTKENIFTVAMLASVVGGMVGLYYQVPRSGWLFSVGGLLTFASQWSKGSRY